MSTRPHVLITAPFDADVAEVLREHCDVVIRPPLENGVSLAESDHVDYLASADILITEIDLVDQASLDAAPALQMVVSCRAMPVNVDMAACEARGVAVKTTPGRNADVTADFAFGLLLSTVRKVSESEAWLRTGEWSMADQYYPYREFRGMMLKGRTLGIVGGGAIGRRMAERARGFGMERIIYDPFVTQDQLGDLGVLADLPELMASSDIVTVHAPLMDSTIGLISDKMIRLMKPTAFVINAGRAAIIDRDALVSALVEGRIHGAGMDVYWDEPPQPDDILFSLPNVTLTPHVAGASDDVVVEHSRLAADHVTAWLSQRVES
jgi:D-3-phosphoglycerate dehydrogenase / 2-oxoglutarate reductase